MAPGFLPGDIGNLRKYNASSIFAPKSHWLYLCSYIIVVVLKTKKHSVFQRKNVDLLMRKTLSLHEALCGFEFKYATHLFVWVCVNQHKITPLIRIKHLDGRELLIKSKPGQVVANNSLKMLEGEGFPHRVWWLASARLEKFFMQLHVHRETSMKEALSLSISWLTFHEMEHLLQHSNVISEKFSLVARRKFCAHVQKRRKFAE